MRAVDEHREPQASAGHFIAMRSWNPVDHAVQPQTAKIVGYFARPVGGGVEALQVGEMVTHLLVAKAIQMLSEQHQGRKQQFMWAARRAGRREICRSMSSLPEHVRCSDKCATLEQPRIFIPVPKRQHITHCANFELAQKTVSGWSVTLEDFLLFHRAGPCSPPW
jgi:hypothetical protein